MVAARNDSVETSNEPEEEDADNELEENELVVEDSD